MAINHNYPNQIGSKYVIACACRSLPVNLLKGWRWAIGLKRKTPNFRKEVFYLVINVFLLTHVCACCYALSALLENNIGRLTWADEVLRQHPRDSLSFYWMMFYFAAYTVTHVVQGPRQPLQETQLLRNIFDSS